MGVERFVSEDRIKGNVYLPITFNAYQYCRNQLVDLIDVTGCDAKNLEDILLQELNTAMVQSQVKLLINTDAPGWGDQEPRNFAEPYKYKEFWKFESREEYIAVLQEFVEIVRKYGLDMLEKMSSPKDPVYATPEMNRYLYESYDSLLDRVHEKYHFDKTGEEGIEEIIRLLYENRSMNFEQAKEFLVEMAVLYIKTVMDCIGGDLKLEGSRCSLGNAGRSNLRISPLANDLVIWREFHQGRSVDEDNLLIICYKQLMG